MLGTDDGDDGDDGDERQGGSACSDEMDELARRAEGDSVTAERLRGEVEYFPDTRHALDEGQQPHHLVLLTTSGNAVEVESTPTTSAHHSVTSLGLDASDGGVAVLTETSVVVVVDDDVLEVPYGHIQGCLDRGFDIHLHGGTGGYVLAVASSAEGSDVSAGVTYLRRMIREHA
jgi:hypothetical protein